MAETIPLSMDTKKQPEIQKLLKKHESKWLERLGEINITSQPIDIIPRKRPLKYIEYEAGAKKQRRRTSRDTPET